MGYRLKPKFCLLCKSGDSHFFNIEILQNTSAHGKIDHINPVFAVCFCVECKIKTNKLTFLEQYKTPLGIRQDLKDFVCQWEKKPQVILAISNVFWHQIEIYLNFRRFNRMKNGFHSFRYVHVTVKEWPNWFDEIWFSAKENTEQSKMKMLQQKCNENKYSSYVKFHINKIIKIAIIFIDTHTYWSCFGFMSKISPNQTPRVWIYHIYLSLLPFR